MESELGLGLNGQDELSVCVSGSTREDRGSLALGKGGCMVRYEGTLLTAKRMPHLCIFFQDMASTGGILCIMNIS